MAFKKTFIVSDESVNSYGFWVRTMGIHLEKAKQNCPAFFNHETWKVPLGHWENLRVDENSRLLADLVIEGTSDEEKMYIRKIDNGDIRGASIGVDVIALNDDVLQLKPGQTRPALQESELFEISVTPLPGNSNALALRYKGKLVTLTNGQINDSIPIPLLNKESDMKSIALKLGLSETATETQILEAISKLQLTANGSEEMRLHIETQAVEQLDTEEKKQLFTELTKSNFKAALSFLKLNKTPAEPPPAGAGAEAAKIKKDVRVSELVQKGKQQLTKEPGNTEESKETFDYLQKHNTVELGRIRRHEPEKYQQLVADYANGMRYKPGK